MLNIQCVFEHILLLVDVPVSEDPFRRCQCYSLNVDLLIEEH